MKIQPVYKNLYSNNIYSDSRSGKFQTSFGFSGTRQQYSIPDIFSISDGKGDVTGKCSNEEYNIHICVMPAKNMSYMQGKIGEDEVNINIKKKKNICGNFVTHIKGNVGEKELALNCKTKDLNHHISGKFNKEFIEVILWDSNQYDSSCIIGKNKKDINMRIANDSYTVIGDATLDPKLLPVLTCLSRIRYSL